MELAELASHDPLTGLGNRRLFLAHLEAALARPTPSRATAVLYPTSTVKTINDTEGHAAGDAVIATVAERLRRPGPPTRGCPVATS
jgi:sigma-B regulation protein RsbU (phosphoserine phosphatase)